MALITVTSLLGQHLLPSIRSITGDFFTYNAPAHRAGDTVEFLSRNTPDFISPLPWPPNSPDLNPVDYEVWGVLQQRVYRSRIRDVDHLKQRLIEECRCFDQNMPLSNCSVSGPSSSTVACSTTRMCPCKRQPL